MRAVRIIFAVLALGMVGGVAAEPRFVAVDVFIDSDKPLAAWQFEFEDRNDMTKIVGIENGEAASFHGAPFYDRDAVATGNSDRIVVADYSLTSQAARQTGRVRVATLHLMVSGKTDFASQLIVAATHGGKRIKAEISVEISEGRDE